VQPRELVLPIVLLEIETGNLRVLESTHEARQWAEEFWDILENDFRFWDARGRAVFIDETFLSTTDSEPTIGPDESNELRRAVSAFVSRASATDPVVAKLSAVLKSLPGDDAR
jgi:hypothetical protein